jgi:hypothetical protein
MNIMQTYEGLFTFYTNDSPQSSITGPSTKLLNEVMLQSGSYTKLYENKVHEKILIDKLVDAIYG